METVLFFVSTVDLALPRDPIWGT